MNLKNRTVLLLPLIPLFGACNRDSVTDGGYVPTYPVISAFTAKPTVITAGGSSQLAWSVTGETAVTVNNAVVSETTLTVTPATTTTYTLIADGRSSATVTVTVGASTTLVYGNLKGADLGVGANLNGALPFLADNAWNKDISAEPVDSKSAAIIANMDLDVGLHPDFGSALINDAPIGMPYMVVASGQHRVPVTFTLYGSESDPGPYPLPLDAPIQGQKIDGTPFEGDRHVLVIDRDANLLYEIANADALSDLSWTASGGAVFHLNSNNVRPTAEPRWTSADAAGLPIFPGLVRYEEASSGVIRHALRLTVRITRKAYVPPATHWASENLNEDRPPMGARIRLKASYSIPSNYSTETRAILQALKTYGFFVADNGNDWELSGAPDSRWNDNNLVFELAKVKGDNFEVVQMLGMETP